MAYLDPGAVTTALPTKTSWGNAARDSIVNHEARIITNAADIVTTDVNLASLDSRVVINDGKITALEGSVAGDWIFHHAANVNVAYVAPGYLLYSGGVGTAGIKIFAQLNYLASWPNSSSISRIDIATTSPWTYHCAVSGSGNGGGGSLVTSTIHPSGLTYALTDPALGHYITAVLGGGTFEIRLVKPVGWISWSLWIEYP